MPQVMSRAEQERFFGEVRPEKMCAVVLGTLDHLWREALKAVLEANHVRIVGEASSEDETVRLLERLRPQIAIIDAFVAFHDDLDSLQRIIRSSKSTAIVLVAPKLTSTKVIEAVNAGVSGVFTNGDSAELVSFLSRKPDPVLYLSRSVVTLLHDSRELAESPSISMSRREREVLQLLVAGITTKEIASQLCISPKTVESHVMRMKQKLRTKETAALVRYALENGFNRVC